jgi:bifunctional UDP-N-acetylglucosamine pyrophosphorylase/glucosamine-1-phosphate N-acetyltransferase
VLTGTTGSFKAIREEKDCSSEEKSVHLCNSGFLCSTLKDFETYLPQLRPNNAAGEYYLTDVPGLAVAQNKSVGVFADVTQEELEGVNSQAQLASMAKYLQDKIIARWMDEGVQFLMPENVYIEPSVTFDPGAIVEPFVYLSGAIHINSSTRITSGTRLTGAQ